MPSGVTAEPRPLALITGASSGIGYRLAAEFACHAAHAAAAASQPAPHSTVGN
jgi:NAD(P)-dependent dehydrogenase (short-subunit alcohol dehydrogenase family)